MLEDINLLIIGMAGTGKTTLWGSLIEFLKDKS